MGTERFQPLPQDYGMNYQIKLAHRLAFMNRVRIKTQLFREIFN